MQCLKMSVFKTLLCCAIPAIVRVFFCHSYKHPGVSSFGIISLEPNEFQGVLNSCFWSGCLRMRSSESHGCASVCAGSCLSGLHPCGSSLHLLWGSGTPFVSVGPYTEWYMSLLCWRSSCFIQPSDLCFNYEWPGTLRPVRQLTGEELCKC